MPKTVDDDGGSAKIDVMVVGAGPVGLLLAGDLAAEGARVTVVEQLTEPTTESRASTLHTRTMDLLSDRGILGRLGRLPNGGAGHFGGIPLDLTAADPDHPFRGQWKCPQTRLESVLQQRAIESGARIYRGHRLTSVTDSGACVELKTVSVDGGRQHTWTATYLAGCDGERSSVRDLGGFEYARVPATQTMLRADIAGIDVRPRRFERLPNGLAVASKWPDGSTRIMVHALDAPARLSDDAPTFDEVVAAWELVTGESIGQGTPLWLNSFDNASCQVTRYCRGRIVLAGDAAHQQMPVGGQALNLGLQDAAALSGALRDCIANPSTGEGLSGYHSDRHAAGVRTLANIRAQTVLLLGGPEVDPLRAIVTELLQFQAVQSHLAGSISGRAQTKTRVVESSTIATAPNTPKESPDMSSLTGKTALVTGSSRGIGRAIARQLAAKGALVVVHYAGNVEAATETVELIEIDGGRAFSVASDLSTPGGVHELFLGLEHGLKERTGRTTLDIVVNNAGATTPEGVAPEDVTPEEFDRLFAINAKAPFFIVQRAIGLLPENGRIVNISSGLTRFANPGQVAYSMTKGAVEQITLHFARHLAPRGITVNSVAPGITNNGSAVFDIPEAVEQMSQLSAFKRVGEAIDVADVVTFLATDEARWITGAFIDATGGTLLG
ncbi:SDR family oxidoreductase [Rhodococcus sp. IEGM 1330]|uniref:SDR family oxidoreductase n=1 Tax=Rhodococcus sp. IEGM 1330 TaxID=3082225 RepID=UPI00295563A6|nr:SDR family oxidoreductase [Rhodococcus sp. IEGM 1330]MDV8022186.1 SDR family oxidoreductase [Rhodococcus sp. IEGM 1330]